MICEICEFFQQNYDDIDWGICLKCPPEKNNIWLKGLETNCPIEQNKQEKENENVLY